MLRDDVQTCEGMGKWPDYETEDVTKEFRQEVLDTLEANKKYNEARGLKRGDKRRLIANKSQLCGVADIDKTHLGKILDGRTGRSNLVGRIRDVLQLQPVMTITVPSSRAETLRALATLPEETFQTYRRAVTDEIDHAKRK